MMGKRGTVLLLVLFFGGLGALWWARRAGVPTAAEREAMAERVLPQLLKVETSEIGRIEVEDPEGGGRVALERRGPGDWQVVEPIEALADGRRVEILLNNLRELRRSPEAGAVSGDLGRFGLEPPGRVVRLYRDRGRQGDGEPIATLALGDELERLRYVKPEGGGAVALADALRVEPDDVDPDAWRERGLFDVYSYDVRSVDVAGPGRSRLGVSQDGGRWRIVAPFKAPANAEAINGLLADLAELEAVAGPEGFAAEGVEDLSAYGLDPPKVTITLVPAGLTGSEEPQAAYLGDAPEGRDDVIYARREGEDDVLLVRPRGVADVSLDPQAMRSRRVVDFRPAEVAAVEIEAGGRDYRLVNGGEGWRVVAPAEGPADALDVATLLETLTGLESAEFFPVDRVDRAGLDDPRATFRVWLAREDDRGGDADASPFDRPSDVGLAIGRFDAGRKLVYGQLAGDERTVLALPDTVQAIIPGGPLALRDRTLVRQDPRTIRRVEVSRGGRTLVLERPSAPAGVAAPREATAWRVVEPTEAPADRLAVSMLVEAMARLRAERRVEAEPGADAGGESSSSFGLDTPSVRVSWESESGEASRTTLLVGSAVPGLSDERYATLEGEPGVFTIGPKLLALLAAEFRERRMLAFPAGQADRVVVRGPGGEAAFVRGESGGWEPEGGTWPGGYDPGLVDSLVVALAALTADRIVQDGGPMPDGSGLEPPLQSVEVRLLGDDATATVRLGATADGLRFAAMGEAGPGAVFLVQASPFALPPVGVVGEVELPVDPFAR